MIVINHDPFGREETVRECISGSFQTCQWCGQHGRQHRLYQYGTRRDDSASGYVNWWRGLFCSISCARTYNWR